MKRILFLAYVLLCVHGAAWGEENSLTVYTGNLGLVTDVRVVNVGKGQKALHFTDVASLVIPESVCLWPLDKGTSSKFHILTQTFLYDLANPERVLDKMLGRHIEIYMEGGAYIQGALLQAYHDSLIVETDDGIKMIPRNEDIMINIGNLPEGLVTRPTLSWDVKGIEEGNQRFQLRYLTEGLEWSPSYVGVLNDDTTRMTLDAWASIRNESGIDFEETRLRLVAGDVQRAEKIRSAGKYSASARTMAATADFEGTARFERQPFFEYHVYRLNQPFTIKNKSVMQVSLWPQAHVKTEKHFVFNHWKHPEGITVRLFFNNDKENGLGEPLPSGIVRLYKKEKGMMIFLGEQHIEHRARKEEVSIDIGRAFDLSGKRRIMESNRLADRRERQTIAIELENHKKEEDVTILVEENMAYGHWKIENYTHDYVKKDIRRVTFAVPVSANNKTTMQFTVLYAW